MPADDQLVANQMLRGKGGGRMVLSLACDRLRPVKFGIDLEFGEIKAGMIEAKKSHAIMQLNKKSFTRRLFSTMSSAECPSFIGKRFCQFSKTLTRGIDAFRLSYLSSFNAAAPIPSKVNASFPLKVLPN